MNHLHVTFENNQTALFLPTERVWVCDWLSDNGEYYAGEDDGPAEDVLKPGVYVLDAEPVTDAFREWVLSASIVARVKSVRTIWQEEVCDVT